MVSDHIVTRAQGKQGSPGYWRALYICRNRLFDEVQAVLSEMRRGSPATADGRHLNADACRGQHHDDRGDRQREHAGRAGVEPAIRIHRVPARSSDRYLSAHSPLDCPNQGVPASVRFAPPPPITIRDRVALMISDGEIAARNLVRTLPVTLPQRGCVRRARGPSPFVDQARTEVSS